MSQPSFDQVDWGGPLPDEHVELETLGDYRAVDPTGRLTVSLDPETGHVINIRPLRTMRLSEPCHLAQVVARDLEEYSFCGCTTGTDARRCLVCRREDRIGYRRVCFLSV